MKKQICLNGHPRTPENIGANRTCLLCCRDRAKKQSQEKPEQKRKYQHRVWEPLKREVLTHYSPSSILNCCWVGCSVSDLDMLTLDHVNNDGYKHQRPGRKTRLCGRELYRWVKAQKYPKSFQTLCWNHQWKKRLMDMKNKQDLVGT